MFIFYDLLLIVFIIFCAPLFAFKRKFHKGFIMRLGILPKEVTDAVKGKDIIWVHAVSVGEANSTQPLIKSLLKKYPQKKIVI